MSKTANIGWDCNSDPENVVDPTGYRVSPLDLELRKQQVEAFHRDYFDDAQAHSCGELRMTDRDDWNCDLYLRNFFINHAPVNNIVYPQTSSPCIEPNRARVLQSSEQDQRSEKYWLQNLAPNQTCPPRGVPTFVSSCKGAQPMNLCSTTGKAIPTKQCGGFSSKKDPLPCPGDDWSRIPGTREGDDLKPWISGINRNIDAESGLRRLNYRNNADCYPNPVCWDNTMCGPVAEAERLRNSRKMFETYFQDNECIYPNFTPKVFNNFTRAKFTMGVEVEPNVEDRMCRGD